MNKTTMPTTLATSEELALRSLELGSIILRPDNPFTWSSGLRMPIYNDNRLLCTRQADRELVFRLAVERIKAKKLLDFNAIFAIPSGGIWLAALLADHFKYSLIIPEDDKFLVIPPRRGRNNLPEFKVARGYDTIISSYPRALAHTTVFAHQQQLNLLYLRPVQKEHGTRKQVEGDITAVGKSRLVADLGDVPDHLTAYYAVKGSGIKIDPSLASFATHQYQVHDNLAGFTMLAVEDLISTGKSSLKEIQKAQDALGSVLHCLSIFSYELKDADEAFEKAKIKKLPLLTYGQLIRVARDQGYVNERNAAPLISWSLDPMQWGERNGFPRVVMTGG